MNFKKLFIVAIMGFTCSAQAQSDWERFEQRTSSAEAQEARAAIAEGQQVFARVLKAYAQKIARANSSQIKKITCEPFKAEVVGYQGSFKVQPFDVCIYSLTNGTLCKHETHGYDGYAEFICVNSQNKRRKVGVQVAEREMKRLNPKELYFRTFADKK